MQDEFDEQEMFHLEEEDTHGGSTTADCDEASSGDPMLRAEASGAGDTSGPQAMGSGKSSLTLQDVNEDEAEAADTVGHLAHRVMQWGSSLPVQSAVRMGSSVPISIPGGLPDFKKAAGAPGAAGAQELQYQGTFIPPHKMSQHEDLVFSLTGASPSAALKRDRLRVRNAILKSTGFLENHVYQTSAALGMQERNRLSGSGRSATGSATMAGGLSQALQGPQG